MKKKFPIKHSINDVYFDKYEKYKQCVFVTGETIFRGNKNKFLLIIRQRQDGKWTLINIIWNKRPTFTIENTLMQTLINTVANDLKTTNMWVTEQTESGGKISTNQILPPKEVIDDVFISNRSQLLKFPASKWDKMWQLIEKRINHDSAFRVQGFRTSDVLTAVSHLKYVFQSSWVQARYKDAGLSSMNDPFEQGSPNWFPAYHLARTAIGAICIDPGWNYLVDIGLAIETLKEFPELDRLKKELTRSTGTQHHLCLAAELYAKNYLIGLEPSTGSGNATNDLLVKVEEDIYAIEVKEFSSSKPIRKILKEMKDKVKKLPKDISTAVIFHVVLSENSNAIDDLEREKQFFIELEQLDIPPKISAVVGGKRVLDAEGGRVKRLTEKIVINTNAKVKSNLYYLELLFQNGHEIKYPTFGVGNGEDSLFYFE